MSSSLSSEAKVLAGRLRNALQCYSGYVTLQSLFKLQTSLQHALIRLVASLSITLSRRVVLPYIAIEQDVWRKNPANFVKLSQCGRRHQDPSIAAPTCSSITRLLWVLRITLPKRLFSTQRRGRGCNEHLLPFCSAGDIKQADSSDKISATRTSAYRDIYDWTWYSPPDVWRMLQSTL